MHGHVDKPAIRAPPRMRAANAHVTRRPLAGRPAAFATFWVKIHRQEWMTEESAHAHRRHSLLQDNPASG
ncbi:hypothetical protein DFR50_111105 [Roseiarcus fermentans]|uniref:Uncharacterized protein n=1 Tax=Roseiarcus fermentans TaxID=1473586 RepID=A0A366FGP1_9HYPH|nr:hypothetical protein [Roseiarcus fermentans]RBP13843.1 hypothetical protein DFR50_111105 [Roseiarcus fermentans]